MKALRAAYGEGAEGRGIGTVERRAKGAVKALEDRQKRRRRRVVRDQLDRAIVDLIAFYRDVLVLQMAAASELVNDEMRPSSNGSRPSPPRRTPCAGSTPSSAPATCSRPTSRPCSPSSR